MNKLTTAVLGLAALNAATYATTMRVVKNDGTIVRYDVADVYYVDFEDEEDNNGSVEHEFVDLGLPSGTLWATCNVGATRPEEYGDYFAWGETKPKAEYYYDTNKWYDPNTENNMNKYTKEDGLIVLLPEDDAATVNWGADWRMPVEDEIRELEQKCTYSWEEINGVKVGKIIGPNGNYIYVPASGDYYGSTLNLEGLFGYFWSASLCGLADRSAYYMTVFANNKGCNGDARGAGKPVRPVRAK